MGCFWGARNVLDPALAQARVPADQSVYPTVREL